MTIILYNGFYTLWWKTRWVFAAVPGAIPGALPVTMGYAANTQEIFSPDSIFLFTILFLWQMPHFWALALKFKDDYQKAGVPTLPNAIGVQRTIYQMGLYTFSYCGVALMAPMFVTVRWFYLIAVFPVVVQIFIEFFRFLKSNGEKRWLAFFMWINVSVLVFLFIPAIDRWLFF
jgi:protoheme IX farnesyltransferase